MTKPRNPTPLDYTASRADQPAASSRRRALAMGIVCTILLAAGVGLNASVAALELSFRKEPVPLRAPVASIPAQLGPWVQLSADTKLSSEVEQTLGTQDYIQRVYVDRRLADPGVLARWEAAMRTIVLITFGLLVAGCANASAPPTTVAPGFTPYAPPELAEGVCAEVAEGPAGYPLNNIERQIAEAYCPELVATSGHPSFPAR